MAVVGGGGGVRQGGSQWGKEGGHSRAHAGAYTRITVAHTTRHCRHCHHCRHWRVQACCGMACVAWLVCHILHGIGGVVWHGSGVAWQRVCCVACGVSSVVRMRARGVAVVCGCAPHPNHDPLSNTLRLTAKGLAAESRDGAKVVESPKGLDMVAAVAGAVAATTG